MVIILFNQHSVFVRSKWVPSCSLTQTQYFAIKCLYDYTNFEYKEPRDPIAPKRTHLFILGNMKMRYIGALWLTMYGSGTWKMASIAPPFLSAAHICQLNGFAYVPLISCEQTGCFGETPGFQALRCTLSGCGRQAAAKERRRPPMPVEKKLEKNPHPSCQWR